MKPARISAACLLFAATASFAAGPGISSETEVRLHLRTEIQPFHDSRQVVPASFESTIVPSKTAIIITDMWDKHWCHGATVRVGQIAQRMEPVLEQARKAGILIIHAPSDTMDFYANTPERKAAENAPASTPPQELVIKDAPLPIDDSNGGCDTGDKDVNKRVWSREIDTLKIVPGDVISDDGRQIYNVLKEHKIDTLLYMGVHANMCILNRTFGVRQMSKWGFRSIIVRDLMDAMYEPSSRPYVSHKEGTELVFKFIEQYWAPSVTSKDLLAGLNAAKTTAKN